MLKTLVAPAAAAFAVLLLVSTVDTAEARRGGGGGGGGGHSVSGGGGHARAFSGGHSRSFSRGPSASARALHAPRIHNRAVGSYPHVTKHYPGHKHGRRHIHRHVFVGAPLAYGYYSYGYGDSCYWLRRKAVYTGSSYWWNRYYACVEGYDYD